jgi:DNA segregation ATPase FtsK/SpoIIIE, S-DNA-T family
MELRLTVRSTAGASADVAIDLDPAAQASTLLSAIANHLGLAPGEVAAAVVERTGELVEPAVPVGEQGLRDGDALLLSHAGEDPTVNGVQHPDAAIELLIVGGPDAGATIPLAPGAHIVGRGPGADIVVGDRSLSRRHVLIEIHDDEVAVADAGSTNGTFLEGEAVTAARPLRPGERLEAGRSLFEVRRRRVADRSSARARDGAVAFNRPPRVGRPTGQVELRVPAPPADADGPRLPLAAALVPLTLGVAMFVITSRPYMLMIAALSPAMAVTSYMETRRAGRRRRSDAERTFADAVDAALEQADEARGREMQQARAAAPGPDDISERAVQLRPDLWERRPDDLDFMHLRVGIADLPSQVPVTIEPGGARALRDEAQARLAAGALLPSMPDAVDLAPGGFVGLAGPPAAVASLGRWLVVQAAVLHSPAELRIAVAVAPQRVGDWDWVKWLPHTRPELLVADPPAADALVESLAGGERTPALLLIVDEALGLDRRRLAALSPRVCVLWLGRDVRELPGATRHIVQLDDVVARLSHTVVETGAVVEDVAADGVDDSYARTVARALAPVRDVVAREGRAQVPTRVSLLDLLGIERLVPEALADRWSTSDDRLAAPLGQAAEAAFEVEVGQVEGLRLLIGGMPGAGKSELLQSLIASLAASHPPDRLSFLLVDYKGGAAFSDAVDLPHTAGLVTDLDEHLADRARVSLLAEVRRREVLLRDAGARNLRELHRRDPHRAPPHLVIVVDEFATLGREVPAFVDTLVDVAQRGRSLGLHLVLATQRPRGAVNDTIRANTNLRIAMRMSDAAESADVIEAGDAAAIPAGLPGRAIALAGRRADGQPQLVPFQAAYAGGRTHVVGAAAATVRALRFGAVAEQQERLVSAIGGAAPTDLQGVVEAARAAAQRLHLPAPPSPWLPPLPEMVGLEDLGAAPPGVAVIGLLDEPQSQRQRPLTLDLDRDGGAVIYGTSRSGRTALLRTIAASLAAGLSPADLHLYGLDFASRALGTLERLPHCGAVIAGDDEERVTRLLRTVQRTMAQRRDDLAAGREGPHATIVLLLDGYAGFTSAFDRVAGGELVQTFNRIAADGRPLGVHVIVTADRRADVPGALAGVLPNRYVLRTADPDEGVALGLPRAAATTELPPGRGFTQEGIELQAAYVDDAALDRLAEAYPDARAPRIGMLPRAIDGARLPAPPGPSQAVLGLDDELLRPVAVDLRQGDLLIAGPHRSGRSTALSTIARSLRRGSPDLPLHLVAPRPGPAADLPGVWTTTAVGAEAAVDALQRLCAAPGPFVVLVDDGTDLPEGLATSALETVLRRGRDEPVRIVAAVESFAAQRAFGGWIRELRNEQRGVLLQPDGEVDGELLGARLGRRPALPLPPGRGYFVVRGASRLVQVAGG